MSKTKKIALGIFAIFLIPFLHASAQTTNIVYSDQYVTILSDGTIQFVSGYDMAISVDLNGTIYGPFVGGISYGDQDLNAILLGNFPDLITTGSSFNMNLCFDDFGSSATSCLSGGQAVDEVPVDVVNGFMYTINGQFATTPVQTTGLPYATSTSSYINTITTTGLPSNISFFNEYATASVASSSLVSTTNFLSFINVPQLLATRIPFAYIFQIYEDIAGDLTSSTTADQSFPNSTFSMQFPTSFNANGLESSTSISINYFSTSTFTEIMSQSTLSVVRELLGAIVWVELGFFLWRDARSKKHLF
jgi:hypothetical protein